MLQKSLQTLKLGLRMRYPSLTRTHHLQINPPASLLTPQLHNKPSNTFHSQQDDACLVSPASSENSLTAHNEITIKVERSDFGDFSRRVESKLPVIDKTAYLYKLLDQRNPVFVMGPEDFGKTFNLTTMQAIFQNGKDWWENHCSNLSIVKDFHYEFPQHPVLSLDFSKVNDLLKLKEYIATALYNLIEKAGLQTEFASAVAEFQENFSDEAFLIFFKEVIIQVSRKYQKGVVILIDEYHQPITTIAHKIQGQKAKSLAEYAKIVATTNLMKQLLEIIKELQVQGHDEVNYVRFGYITGVIPMGFLSSSPASSDLFETWKHNEFKGVIGYTEDEIFERFENDLEDMTKKELKLDDLDEAGKEKIAKIRKNFENDLRKNYSGLRFSYDQEQPFYSPKVINSLFDNWKTAPNLKVPSLYADSTLSKLIWKAVKSMPLRVKQKFFQALLDEKNAYSLFTYSKDQLLFNKTLEDLLFKPEEICFFNGAVSVQKEKSSQDLLSLGLANNEMRKALLQELENQMGSPNSVINTIEQLIDGHFVGYLCSIYERRKLLSAFTNISHIQGRADHDLQFYKPKLFAVVHNQLVKFAQDKQIKKKFGIKNFGFVEEKVIGSSRLEFMLYFEIEEGDSTEKKVLLVSEFELISPSSFYDDRHYERLEKEMTEKIARKLSEEKERFLKKGFSKQYEFLKDYQRIWVAAIEESGHLKRVVFSEEKTVDGEDGLVQFMV